MMIDAGVTPGATLNPAILAMLADPAATYPHLHHAKRGCYAARVARPERLA